MKKPKTLEIKVIRAELRNRKIILTLEPDLLTGEEFAVNPFYNEGTEKNKVREIFIRVDLTEVDGRISAKSEYSGTHYTKGHTQLHSLNSMYLDKKDCAIAEIQNTPIKYIKDESRMNKLLAMFNDDQEFAIKLEDLISERKEIHQKGKLKQALSEYEEARKSLENAMFKSIIK